MNKALVISDTKNYNWSGANIRIQVALAGETLGSDRQRLMVFQGLNGCSKGTLGRGSLVPMLC